MDHGESGCGSSQGHEAVNRLYELTKDGDTGSGEYRELDILVYDSLLRAYGVQPEDAPRRSVQVA